MRSLQQWNILICLIYVKVKLEETGGDEMRDYFSREFGSTVLPRSFVFSPSASNVYSSNSSQLFFQFVFNFCFYFWPWIVAAAATTSSCRYLVTASRVARPDTGGFAAAHK